MTDDIAVQSLSFGDKYWNKLTAELKERGYIPESDVLTGVDVSVRTNDVVTVSNVEHETIKNKPKTRD